MENIKTNFKQNMHFAYAAKIGKTRGHVLSFRV